MNTLQADYVGELNRKDGLSCYRCGICGDVVFELDLERYEPAQGEGLIECCTKCREDFESDEEVQVDTDLIDPALFSRFREWALNNRESSGAESG